MDEILKGKIVRIILEFTPHVVSKMFMPYIEELAEAILNEIEDK